MSQLEGERCRLLDAHLAGALPLDLFSEKQREMASRLRSSQEKIAASERSNETAMEGLELARKLLDKAGDAYREADTMTQRAWIQVFFHKIFVSSETGHPEVAGAELTDPFAQLLSEDLVDALLPCNAKPAAFAAGGSNVDQIVETVGIQPTFHPPSLPLWTRSGIEF